MRQRGRLRRRRNRRGVAEIIGVILLLAMTIVAGALLWSFRIYTPPAPPTISFTIRTGGSNPVWGDPTDCQPWGYNITDYEEETYNGTTGGLDSSKVADWVGGDNDEPPDTSWFAECENSVTGNFSTMPSTQIIISAHSPSAIPLDDIDFTFVCYNSTATGGTTILVNGTLASMTWFPGLTSEPASDAPLLGYCGNFNAGGFEGAAYGTYYNRLGLFVPLSQGITTLENGDTLILYLHTSTETVGGRTIVPPLDFMCVANAGGVTFDDQTPEDGCHETYSSGGDHSTTEYIPTFQSDFDDYHGAPPWCFSTPGSCEIYLTYTGYPSTVLAAIPLNTLAPPST